MAHLWESESHNDVVVVMSTIQSLGFRISLLLTSFNLQATHILAHNVGPVSSCTRKFFIGNHVLSAPLNYKHSPKFRGIVCVSLLAFSSNG